MYAFQSMKIALNYLNNMVLNMESLKQTQTQFPFSSGLLGPNFQK